MFGSRFRKQKLSRVAPERSTREIADSRKRIRDELRAALYWYNNEKFIISAIADIAEYGEPVVLDADVPNEQLGLALCDKLLAYTPRPAPPDRGLEDWASFKASGARSGRSFEQASTYVYVSTVNTAIRIEAAPRVTNEMDLKALCTVGSGQLHIDIGVAIRKAIAASTALREAKLL